MKIIILGLSEMVSYLPLIESINEIKKDWEIRFINDTNEDKINDYPVLGKILQCTFKIFKK